MKDLMEQLSAARWRVQFNVVSNQPNAFYIQSDIHGELCILSLMFDNGKNYHFEGYRGFSTTKELLQWFKSARVGDITVNKMWMPSNALQDLKVVCTRDELFDTYPEVLV